MTTRRVLLVWMVSLLIVTVWALSFIYARYPVKPHLYVLSAPIWHVGLLVFWFCFQVYAGVCVVYWVWGVQLRRKHLAQQPPDHTQ